MALFRRNKTDQTGMPPEVQSYYQIEHRQRSWVAWLMAFVTLFVTVVVVLGIFFGGRWTYRKLKKTDQPTVAVVETEAPTDKKTPNTPTPQTSSTSTSQPSQTPTPSTPTTPSIDSPATTSTTSTPGANLPTGKAGLPNTGPGDTLAIFIVTSAIGTIFYDRVLRTRSSRL